MKKTLLFCTFLVILLIIAGCAYQILQEKKEAQNQPMSNEEMELNESDEIGAIEDEAEILNQELQNKLSLLQGKWRSIDDLNSTIEFKDKRKIDYYSNEKLSEGDFNLSGEYLTVSSDNEAFEYRIIDLSDKSLTLMYLPRGNMLEYERMQ